MWYVVGQARDKLARCSRMQDRFCTRLLVHGNSALGLPAAADLVDKPFKVAQIHTVLPKQACATFKGDLDKVRPIAVANARNFSPE